MYQVRDSIRVTVGVVMVALFAVLKVDQSNLPVLAIGDSDRARVGDVVTAFNGVPVADTNSLRNAVAGTPPGTEVTLTIIREGSEQQLRVTLGELNTDVR